MKGPIGHTFMYNIIIIFIVLLFALLAGTLAYYKAFKTNNKIISALEKYEGYNKSSKDEIELQLGNIGYEGIDESKCNDESHNMQLVTVKDEEQRFRYCIYIKTEKEYSDKIPKGREYYQYGVITYMSLDLPFVDMIKIPIFTRSNRIYKFNTGK